MAIRASVVKGGLRPSYIEEITLARELHDSDHIHVPRFGEVIPTPAPYGLSADGRIDINLADAALLETLLGIGPTIAQRTIECREMNGYFTTVEELQAVNGIGPGKFEKIREQIAVGERP
jgi:competence protein ComEA